MSGYQPIIINGVVVSKGYRDCDTRWKIIKPYIGKSVLDIGSHYGFFVYKILTELNSEVTSIEMDLKQAAIQKKMLRDNNLKADVRVIRFNPNTDFEPVETILLLAVIHYFSPGEVSRLFKILRNKCKTLIIEIPNSAEKVASKPVLQQDILGMLRESFNVQPIGEVSSPQSKFIKRTLYKCTVVL